MPEPMPTAAPAAPTNGAAKLAERAQTPPTSSTPEEPRTVRVRAHQRAVKVKEQLAAEARGEEPAEPKAKAETREPDS